MGSTSQPLTIAILGGGIAGLALAAGLTKKPHLSVTAFESILAHRDVGAGLALHLNAIKAMALIGPEVRQAYLDKATSIASEADQEIATEVILAQGPHAGQLVAELGRAKGRKSVSRADLLDGLLALLPEGTVRYGKKVDKIWTTQNGGKDEDEFKVCVGFGENKGFFEADCVLAADGIHSVARGHLLGEDHPATKPKNHDRWQVYRTLVSAEEARGQINERWLTTVPILLGPCGHVNVIPLNKGTRISAGVAVRGVADSKEAAGGPDDVTYHDSNDGDKKQGLDPGLYADYSEDAQRIVRMVAKDTSASWSVGDHDHAPFYAKGRVAMLGDAAHASLPFAGNGAAQALEDAAVLDHLFSRVKRVEDIEAALRAYDATRRPRSQAVVDLARQFGRVYAYATEDKMHEDPERMRKFFGGWAAFTNNADLGKQNDDAMRAYEQFLASGIGSGVESRDFV
ncbi:hypothetical protein B0H63DRAFT_564032 [Podospora didyma]|uniref:FAD-binding domain-containing protein n=1 Tax=Podospora didyma TaxID=330526 RepID=A0AAE0N732_9PEZI|nr:hypothetical protein B0H63DRAFT_564032 [Podospora didyma]